MVICYLDLIILILYTVINVVASGYYLIKIIPIINNLPYPVSQFWLKVDYTSIPTNTTTFVPLDSISNIVANTNLYQLLL